MKAGEYAGPETKSIVLEKLRDQDAECHACGKIGRPRHLIHLARLCQHFIALCGRCWKEFQYIVRPFCDCGEPCHCGKVRNHYCNHKA